MSWPPGACLQCGRTDSWVDVTSMGSAVTTLLCSNCGQQMFTAFPNGAVYYTTIMSSNGTHPTPLYSTASSYTSSGGGITWANVAPPSGSLEPEPLPDLPLVFDDKPLIGWRLWRVQLDWQTLQGSKRPRLTGISMREPWLPGNAQVSRCARENHTTHDAPNRCCGCGYWAVCEQRIPSLLELLGGDDGWVAGRVALWGHVLEFERGYRAQYAYPLDLQYVGRLTEPPGMLRQLCEDYNVPAGNHEQLRGALLPALPALAPFQPPVAPPLPAVPRTPQGTTKSRMDYINAYTNHMWAAANRTRGWFAT